MKYIFAIILGLALGACTTMNADTPAKKLAVAYSTVQAVATTTTQLLNAGKLTKEDARAIAAGNDAALAGLDAVRAMPSADANARITQILAVLTATQTYLATRGAH